jgi:hypothetical protein
MIQYLIPFLEEHRNAIIIGILMTAKELLEYYLGRTKKVEAGSTLELILLTIKKLRKYFR